MHDENSYLTPQAPSKVITAEQRARISQNFRTAKALLSRKRPFSTSFKSSDAVGTDGAAEGNSSSKRVPLMEISTNTTTPFYAKALKVTDDCVTDSFVTPAKQTGCLGSLDCSSTPGILDDDDDFDESVLKEIDAICEQTSAVKAEGRSPDTVAELKPCGSFCEDVKVEGEDEFQYGDMPAEYLKYLKSLNDRQREAACTDISVPLMIAAGPGSGKTSTMVGRILKLISEGISPSNILAMTFTTAAASEMRDRIKAVAGKNVAKDLTISTFHSFSLQLCRSHAEKIERTSEFLIYGHSHQRRAIIEAVRLLENENSVLKNHDECKIGEDSKEVLPLEYFKDKSKKWQKFVTQAKASGKTPVDCHKMGDMLGAAILGNYNNILRSCNALDYHDMISCSVKLLSDFPEVLKECQDSWKAIVIDEFQDTSAMQYRLLRLLASHNHITIVGDDDQSIFSFNGADISGFESFRSHFPNFKEIRLNKNYRSTRYIVEAASSLIRNNIKRCQFKDALTDNSCGSKITIKECQNENAQCAYVVDKILETAFDGSPAKPCYGSIAILYRRYRERCSSYYFVKGRYHLMFMVWPSIGKR